MPSLNRFPLLGLWAREAALRIGFGEAEADTIGHAYAVLYAIRANSPVRPGKYKDAEAKAAAEKALAEPSDIELLDFGDDELQVTRSREGRLIGRVGNAEPQTPESYRYKIVRKFPSGYHEKLQSTFRDFFAGYTPEKLNTRLIYTLYDQWKKACAAGRMVDLDKLLAWCVERKPSAKAAGKQP
jgi:hypothetical protein